MNHDDFLALVDGRRGHFLYESGYHSSLWFDLESLCLRPERLRPFVQELCGEIAEMQPEVICGPLIEGAFVGLLAARELEREFVYTLRRDDGAEGRMFGVRYELPVALRGAVMGKRVVVVNDVISAGSAVRGAMESLRDAGAEVVGVASLVVLGDSFFEFAERERVPVRTLLRMPNEMWEPASCPLCRDGVALERLAEH